MKSRRSILFTAVTLFAALAIPLRLAAQNKQDHKNAKHHHYQLIDMGTFGGPVSSIGQGPIPLNRHGLTVGWSATSSSTSSTSNPLVCGGLDGVVPFITTTFQWNNGGLTNLGALPGGSNCSEPLWVNDAGEIVGTSENGLVDPLAGVNQTRAVLWNHGQIADLGGFGGYQNAAQAINNRGLIAGFSLNTIPDPYSLNEFVFFGSSNGTQTRAFLWQHGVMRDLGTLGTGNDAGALLINERGQVAGEAYTSSIPNPATGIPPLDPFFWNGKMVDIGTLGGAVGFPTFMNNRGEVIGLSSVAANPAACLSEGDPDCHPFLWDQSGRLIDLNTDTIGANPINAFAINDAGEIVGQAAFPDAPFDGYMRDNGVATDVGHLEGDCFSLATFINSPGQIVGNSFSCDGNFHHAFIWENGTIADLNTLIPANSTLQLVASVEINDRGEIVGNGAPPGTDPANIQTQGHAFLLIPCDEGHRDVEGCDYTLVDGAATMTGVGSTPVTRLTTASGDISRLRGTSNPRLRRFEGLVRKEGIKQ